MDHDSNSSETQSETQSDSKSENQRDTKSVKCKQFITSFTPLGEVEKGKTCPQCLQFLSISMFRCKKGTRYGAQGTIRNYKCRICESGETVKGVDVNVEDMKKKIYDLEDRLSVFEKSYTRDTALTAFILNALLRPHGFDLIKAEDKMHRGEELIIPSSRIDNTQLDQSRTRSTLSKL